MTDTRTMVAGGTAGLLAFGATVEREGGNE